MYHKLNLLIILFLFSCSSEPVRQDLVPAQSDSYWDDLGEFVAGNVISDKNRFIQLTTSSSYKRYSVQMDKLWEKIAKKHREQVIPWKQENLTNLSPKNVTLYPLAGGDFVNLYMLNSESTRYIMIGLQKPGFIRDPSLFTELELSRGLNSIQNVVTELADYNYSTSRRLQKEVANPYLTGIAPTLLFFLKRFEFQIHDVERVFLNDKGLVEKDESTFEVFDKKKTAGVRIRFYKKGDQYLRELFFFRIWLSGKSATKETVEGKFIHSQGRLNLMFKSAEYIFHTPEYKDFLVTLVDKADRVVEDESGIPFRLFPKEEWDYRVYGKYIGKIPLKNTPRVPFQSDLYEVFQKQGKPLPFDFGYGVLKGKGMSNLLLFERKSLQSKAQE